jgi:secernin
LAADEGRISATTMMRILRDHYEDTFLDGPQFHPYLPDFHTICMHDSPAGFTWGNTATSLVAELDPQGNEPPRIRVAYLPPCTSVYITVPFSRDLPEALTAPGEAGLKPTAPVDAPPDSFASDSLWWRLHRLVEQTARRPRRRRTEVRTLFDRIEQAQEQELDRLARLRSPGESAGKAAAELARQTVERTLAAISELERHWGVILPQPVVNE